MERGGLGCTQGLESLEEVATTSMFVVEEKKNYQQPWKARSTRVDQAVDCWLLMMVSAL